MIEARISASIDEIPRAAWNALLDAEASPFVDHRWLWAMEASGCADRKAGWLPVHFTLWRAGALIAAAPAYVRGGSDGDFSRDWGWAEAAARAGIAYYPKLIFSVPFTPCTGRRFLVAPGEDPAAITAQLLATARAWAIEQGISSMHVLFPDRDEADTLESLGISRRVDFQFHWVNDGYQTPEEFLARFDSKKRNQARRERAEPEKQGITIRTLRRDDLARDLPGYARTAFELHRSTVDKLMWGRRWLNLAFYQHVFEAMPEHCELVLAEQSGRVVAGAFNVAGGNRLYGRYWGCFEDHRFLHFNVCLYHSIDQCIGRGTAAMEGGAGGEHKRARGFLPALTYSNHQFFDARLEKPISAFIAQEAAERERSLERWKAESPILKPRHADPR